MGASATDPSPFRGPGPREAGGELEWLLGVARELAGSAEVTVTFARGSAAASARVLVAGIEAVGIGTDPHSALGDACQGLADWLAHAKRDKQRA